VVENFQNNVDSPVI